MDIIQIYQHADEIAPKADYCVSGCGKCCEHSDAKVFLTRAEAEYISKKLDRPLAKVTPKHPNLYKNRKFAGNCTFYDTEIKGCSIYEDRPLGCRLYMCDGSHAFSRDQRFIDAYVELAPQLGDGEVADIREWFPHDVETILDRHEKIALQFSGGKDSLACLLLLKPYLDRITVYWLNAGDAFPETVARIREVAKDIPNFVEILGKVHQTWSNYGIPSDLIPYSSTYQAHACNSGYTPLMQDRVSCCYRSLMEPMHQRMIDDGMTLIIRGQKNDDSHKGQLVSGEIHTGIEFYYPIQDWTRDEVLSFLDANGFDEQAYYTSGMEHAPECMTCSAWWDDGHGDYLKMKYPDKHAEYISRLKIIQLAVEDSQNNLIKELANA